MSADIKITHIIRAHGEAAAIKQTQRHFARERDRDTPEPDWN